MSEWGSLKFFVGGVPSDTKKRELLGLLRQYGVVSRITNFNPTRGKKLLGFCFVRFECLYSDDIYIKEKEIKFKGRSLEIDPIVRRSCLKKRVEEKHLRRVYLPCVPNGMQEDDLRKIFNNYGKVTNCYLVESRDRKPKEELEDSSSAPKILRSYAFVIFEDASVAQKIIAMKNLLISSTTYLEVKKYTNFSTAVKPSTQDSQFDYFYKPTSQIYFDKTNRPNLNKSNIRLNIQIKVLAK